MAGTGESTERLEGMTVPLAPLLKILECAVCLEVVKIPFKSCQRGHLVCNKCIQTLLRCPTCQAEFTTENHVSVKNIVEMLPKACRYAGNGCKEFVGSNHDERFCGFRSISCEDFQYMTNKNLLAREFHKRTLRFAENGGLVTYNRVDKQVFINRFCYSSVLDLLNSLKSVFVPHLEYGALFLLTFTKRELDDFVAISFTSYFIGKPVDDVSILITLEANNVELRLLLKACRDGETDKDILERSQTTVTTDMFTKLLDINLNLNYSYEIFKSSS